jgi:hypothetical protein
MASGHAFALRYFFFFLYISHYKKSLAFCHFLCHLWYRFFSRNSYLNEDHKWFTEFYILDNCWILRRSCRPEAHLPIRYNTESDCYNRASLPFWLMRDSTCFRMLQVTTPVDLHLSVLHISISLAVLNCQAQILHRVVL